MPILPEGACNATTQVVANVGDTDVRAFIGERMRNGRADPSRSTRDNRDLA